MDKKHKAINITALITALASIGGGGAHYITSTATNDVIKMRTAEKLIVLEEWRKSATRDIEDLRRDVRFLRDVSIKHQTSLEGVTPRRSSARESIEGAGYLLDGIGARSFTSSMPPPRVEPRHVKAYLEKMYAGRRRRED